MKLFSFATLSAIAIATEGLPLLLNSTTSAGAGPSASAIEPSLVPTALTSAPSAPVPSNGTSATSSVASASESVPTFATELPVNSTQSTLPTFATSESPVSETPLPTYGESTSVGVPTSLLASVTPIPSFGSNSTQPSISFPASTFGVNSTQPVLPTFTPPVNGSALPTFSPSSPVNGSVTSVIPTEVPGWSSSQVPPPVTSAVVPPSQGVSSVSSALETSYPETNDSTVVYSSSVQTEELPTGVPTALPTSDVASATTQTVNTDIPSALTSLLPTPTSNGPEDDPSNGSGNGHGNGHGHGHGAGGAGHGHGQWNDTSRFQLKIGSSDHAINNKYLTPLFAGIGIHNLYPTFFHAGSYSIENSQLAFNAFNDTLNAAIVESEGFGNTTLPLVQVLPDVAGDSGFGFNYRGQLTVNGTGQFYACNAKDNKYIKLPAIAFVQNHNETQHHTLRVNGCKKIDILRSYH